MSFCRGPPLSSWAAAAEFITFFWLRTLADRCWQQTTNSPHSTPCTVAVVAKESAVAKGRRTSGSATFSHFLSTQSVAKRKGERYNHGCRKSPSFTLYIPLLLLLLFLLLRSEELNRQWLEKIEKWRTLTAAGLAPSRLPLWFFLLRPYVPACGSMCVCLRVHVCMPVPQVPRLPQQVGKILARPSKLKALGYSCRAYSDSLRESGPVESSHLADAQGLATTSACASTAVVITSGLAAITERTSQWVLARHIPLRLLLAVQAETDDPDMRVGTTLYVEKRKGHLSCQQQ